MWLSEQEVGLEPSDRNVLVFLCVIGAAGLITGWWLIASYGPVLLDWIAITFSDGLGFKASAAIGFFLTLAVLALFALVSDGGIFGEAQVLIGSFFGFFIAFTLLVAWIF